MLLSSCGIKPEIKEISNYKADGFTYKNRTYSYTAFYAADEDAELIGYTSDYHDPIYSFGNTDSPNVILVIGSDNSLPVVADDYTIPTSGTITKVLVDPGLRAKNDKALSDKSDIDMVISLTQTAGEETELYLDNYHTCGNEFYYEYNNSAAATKETLGGYVARSDGKWYYVSPSNLEKVVEAENGSANAVKIRGVEITDEKMSDWLSGSELTEYIE